MKNAFLLTLLSITFVLNAQIYKDPKAPIANRVTDLISHMTLEEKINYINGVNWMYLKPIERLGIPMLKMTDGPTGTNTHGKSTAYPASVMSAATWDTDLSYKLGVALGRDCRSRNVNFLLAPGVNIARAPMTGRNFEYLGEDPYLAGNLAVEYIKGVQDQGVVATVKHFAANNQEYDRNNISSDIDERTLQEIYLPAFKAAVQKGHVDAVMNSYNRLNGEQTAHNKHLNLEILKGQWGFDGILMSDWGGTYNGLAAFNGGLDLEMPGNEYMIAKNIIPALERKDNTEAQIDEKLRRIFSVCFKYGFYDRPQLIESIPNDDPTSVNVALDIARGGVVLLKNQDNILPLDISKIKKIAFIGPNADIFNTGGGSSKTEPFHYTSTLDAFKNMAKNVEVNYTMGIPSLSYLATKSTFYTESGSNTIGLKAEYFNNRDLNGTPKGSKIEQNVNHEWVQTPGIDGIGQDNFSVRWTGVIRPTQTANYKFTVKGDDGYRLFVNGKVVIDYWSDHGNIEKNVMLQLEAGKEYPIKLEYYEGGGDAAITLAWFQPKDENYNEAIKMATEADFTVLCVGFDKQIEHEGAERPFELPAAQDSLIKVVTKANPNTIVILNAGGNVYMEKWLPNVKALLHAFYPGQEGGTALAEILLGKVNPSGKLPVSFEKKWQDNPTFANYYDPDGDKRVEYKEGILVGYRYYDTKNVEPMFPFGFGMSYTKFEYSNLKVNLKQLKEKIVATVTFEVKNIGNMYGAEVAELYVSDKECSVIRPSKELKGFSKVFLKKGEKKKITIELDESAFSYYKENLNHFGFDAGKFEILVGGSSKDIKLKKSILLN